MKWNILAKLTSTQPQERVEELIKILVANRHLEDPVEINSFLNPPNPLDIDLVETGIDQKAAAKALKRIVEAINKQEKIVVYGDYDADGITATAILWETLHALGAQAVPFIPHRQRHGYGLSIAGLEDIITSGKPDLVITVDNGIVAHEACEFLNSQGIDVIITDHHQQADTLPAALSIVHSDKIAGSAVAWFFGKYVLEESGITPIKEIQPQDTLDLVGIGTIADLMPMLSINRSLAKAGMAEITQTKRPGLVALKKEAGIEDGTQIGAYHVGFIIGPRINAMGRIDHGMDALRLLCTKQTDSANQLAHVLGSTNKDRQDLTYTSVQIALEMYERDFDPKDKIIIIDHHDFHEGIIGLIAGKLTETYYRPSIVISREGEHSKASARSIEGVNIIELIRSQIDFLTNAGGHPGAAGFSMPSENIDGFRDALIEYANEFIDDGLLERTLTLEAAIEIADINLSLFERLNQLEPFGVGNDKPLFAITARPVELRTVGRENAHLKLKLADPHDQLPPIDAIGFNLGHLITQIDSQEIFDFAGYLDKNEWNGKTSVQVIVKEIKLER